MSEQQKIWNESSEQKAVPRHVGFALMAVTAREVMNDPERYASDHWLAPSRRVGMMRQAYAEAGYGHMLEDTEKV